MDKTKLPEKGTPTVQFNIRLPQDLAFQVKVSAVRSGRKIHEFVREALERQLGRAGGGRHGRGSAL